MANKTNKKKVRQPKRTRKETFLLNVIASAMALGNFHTSDVLELLTGMTEADMRYILERTRKIEDNPAVALDVTQDEYADFDRE